MLTESLSKVIQEIESLNEKEQNQIANLLQEELNWSNSFGKSQDLLSLLADEALTEFVNKDTKPILL